ncbi:antistasin-like [Physella acuta]|uniref:antistasin-like n=1 Tax=Physella acuta TaxID=109671 RepID=UPI0027DCE1EA|nr:antistasin-like [Physella acuta]
MKIFIFICVCTLYITYISPTPLSKLTDRCTVSCHKLLGVPCPDGSHCPLSACQMTCPNEYQRSEKCGVIVCLTLCEHGRELDENGCPTCTCV